MRFLRSALFASSVVVLGFAAGCGSLEDAAKDAAASELGVSQLKTEDVDTILADAGATGKLDNFKIQAGLEITENFPVDLSKEEEVAIPVSIPQPDAFTGESRSLLFLRAKKFTIAGTAMTRLEVVTVAKVEPDDIGAKLSLKGGEFTKHLDDDQKVTKANQTGKYILVEGKGTGGLVFIKGVITIKRQNNTTDLVKGAWVYSDASPFITQTGSKGEFVLPVPEGADGNIVAFHDTIATAYSAPGTPTVSTKAISKAGLLDKYKGEATSKMDDAGLSSENKTAALGAFDDLNKDVTDFFDAWTTVAVDLVFVQPPQTPPSPPAPPAVPAQTPDPAPEPSAAAVVITRTSATEPQVDLGCTGVDASGNSTFVTDGSKYDDYATYKGWRIKGHVISSTAEHGNIFGSPATIRADAEKAKRYPDNAEGYCLISSGDGLKKARDAASASTDNSIYEPEDGKISEMWQKVQTPGKDSGYNWIKIRVAFFSQEFPRWVGTNFNDSFFIKFDESPDFIGTGNLNDLAGGKDAVSTCKDNATFTSGTQVSCGEWKSVTGSSITTGVLWDIDKSTHAVSQGSKFQCGDGKCFHGYIPARVICKKLNPDTEMGRELTLRFNVSDAGDKFYDSALAVDSVVFSNEDCDASSFNGDERSKALQE